MVSRRTVFASSPSVIAALTVMAALGAGSEATVMHTLLLGPEQSQRFVLQRWTYGSGEDGCGPNADLFPACLERIRNLANAGWRASRSLAIILMLS